CNDKDDRSMHLVCDSFVSEFITPSDIDQLNRELDVYLLEVASEEADILTYWKTSHNKWPKLAELAKQVLLAQASSASCERLFSRCKQFVTPERNRMALEAVTMSVLVDAWLKFFSD
ncbi:hypothetical protein EC973_007884, partial [Apophysomyces ossiformis]